MKTRTLIWLKNLKSFYIPLIRTNRIPSLLGFIKDTLKWLDLIFIISKRYLIKNHSRPKEKPQKEKRTKNSDSINSFSWNAGHNSNKYYPQICENIPRFRSIKSVECLLNQSCCHKILETNVHFKQWPDRVQYKRLYKEK